MTNRLLDYRPLAKPSVVYPAADEVRGDWLKRRWSQAQALIEETMGKYPATTVIVGLSLGVALGWFIKRRGTACSQPIER